MESLLKNLKEYVTCSICSETYTKPKTIACLHTFCCECLERHALTSQKQGFYRCPECQAQICIPEGKRFDNLPSSFLHNSLLSLLAVRRSGEGSEISCSTCQKKSAEINYCFDCEKFMCPDCVKAHEVFRDTLFQGHQVTPVRQFQAADYEALLKRRSFCSERLLKSPFTIVVKAREFNIAGKLDFQGEVPQAPAGIAVNSKGVIAVADYDGHCILVFDETGKFVRKIGGQGDKDGQFESPIDFTFLNDDEILVADECNHRIQQLNVQTGSFVKSFGKEGSGDGEFENPVCVCITSDGRFIVVADHDNSRIQVFTMDGEQRPRKAGSSVQLRLLRGKVLCN